MAEDTSAQDYVRVKRRNTIIFLYVQLSDTASDLRQKLSAISKVDAAEMKLFLDKNGDVPLDEKKSLADQKARPLPGRASTQCRTLAVPPPASAADPDGAPLRAAQVENDQEIFLVGAPEEGA
ncbi:hypothetical protein EMIHUDRAFT_222521 [Emiliania huxleyi CCMP1516]|uniref:Ubiquitin-like domain-containing protein n=2 Tax=Emiliania huxleyi TaxID=2903 RepID=A0A0D3KYB6_EMIH1|nr:hypothetical protein EMIHUDRAFT_222521 [Emiliania huxleyi CCMP1516]EOD40751.1 hypothetical protein EMIHUDRAFT_222521 [Emiliania huxleyi CCMP1516]|eukprot:XP_005793180.1 hypothetical protein EMIHUDRAFT_222521 [Emiliania huxleyi CCMP1516]